MGVKAINQLANSNNYVTGKVISIPANQLYLGIDFLTDRNTLLDTCIIDSPHFGLMRTFEANGNVENTDYIRRFEQGRLDSRSSKIISKKLISKMSDKFHHMRGQILTASYFPVQVYQIGKRYYIADGKHRAALAALLANEVLCQEIGPGFIFDSFRLWQYHLIENDNQYSKTVQLYNRAKGELNCEEKI